MEHVDKHQKGQRKTFVFADRYPRRKQISFYFEKRLIIKQRTNKSNRRTLTTKYLQKMNDNQNYRIQQRGRPSSRVLAPSGGQSSLSFGLLPAKKDIATTSTPTKEDDNKDEQSKRKCIFNETNKKKQSNSKWFSFGVVLFDIKLVTNLSPFCFFFVYCISMVFSIS